MKAGLKGVMEPRTGALFLTREIRYAKKMLLKPVIF